MLLVLAVSLVLFLAAVACGGKAGIAPAYQLDYQVCIDNIIGDSGFTETHAARYCTCLINRAAKDYTAVQLYTVLRGDGADFANSLVVMSMGVECLSK
jgi:hypothetical protein